MAYGDVGGAVTELIVTCQTPNSGGVAFSKGDAVKLTGAYTVDNVTADEDVVFGQIMADATENDVAVPVKVGGISIFTYVGADPTVDGQKGVLASATDCSVKTPLSGDGVGINVKVNATTNQVHVLM